jgi:hypothetical protein
MEETYTITMRGEFFLGDFTESQTRTLSLSRDPDLFRIIVDYLSSYEVLQLDESVIPKRMRPDAVLRNLLTDVKYYLLDGLVSQLSQTNRSRPRPQKPLPRRISF